MYFYINEKLNIMKKHITIDIKEVLEFESTFEQQRELVKYILVELMNNSEMNKVLKEVINEMLEVEIEFGGRENNINIYKSLIEILK